jgi:hypothetical protein
MIPAKANDLGNCQRRMVCSDSMVNIRDERLVPFTYLRLRVDLLRVEEGENRIDGSDRGVGIAT